MFDNLLNRRWSEAQQKVGIQPGQILLTWEITENYPHFKKPRGFGVTILQAPNRCHMAFSPKILNADVHRADGVVRHEIAHALDMCLSSRYLTSVLGRLPPPHQAEIRADAIAEALWKEPIYYDEDLFVQTTMHGVRPRPKHLGW